MDIIEIFEVFPTQDACIAYLEQVRWKGEPRCPYCKSPKNTPLTKERRYHCNNCNTSYSVTVRTIFHKTHLPLQNWFLAVSLILNAKKGISARQLGRHLKVHRNTAWRISMKIREAMMEQEQRNLLTGLIEMDETYVGGKRRRTYKDRHDKKKYHVTKKVPVIGMRERGGRVTAKVVKKKDVNARKLSMLVRENIDTAKSLLITDQANYYKKMRNILPHKTINHSIWYVDGWIHTNSIESFWALLKRGIIGQFHKVSIRHLPKYISEFSYRFNHRDHKDLFALTIQRGIGVI